MNIISASRRTDIPAFHSDWVMDRFREKSVNVINPFNNKVSAVSLAQGEVIAIVFWTKNAAPLTRYLEELSDSGYHFTFLYTINNYPELVEPEVPDIGLTMKTVEHLFKNYGRNVLRWRYDTIVFTEFLDRSWHKRNFSKLCDLMGPFVDECIFSFCDYYKKTRKKMKIHLPDYREPDQAESLEFALELAEISSNHGIKMLSCAHDFLALGPIGPASCIDAEFLKRLFHSADQKRLFDEIERKPTRKDCRCVASIDIGRYNTCRHGCIYCYATN
ncbi:MAG: DUF1848 domain-containing protein [Desulfomonilaceae bacterium]